MNWVQDCIEWDKSRNNFEFNKQSVFDMLEEELIEFRDAETHEEEIDGLCDLVKIAISEMWKKGYCPNKSMAETLREINSRQQDPKQKEVWEKWGASGKWLKDVNQDESMKYKADYSKCLYE